MTQPPGSGDAKPTAVDEGWGDLLGDAPAAPLPSPVSTAEPQSTDASAAQSSTSPNSPAEGPTDSPAEGPTGVSSSADDRPGHVENQSVAVVPSAERSSAATEAETSAGSTMVERTPAESEVKVAVPATVVEGARGEPDTKPAVVAPVGPLGEGNDPAANPLEGSHERSVRSFVIETKIGSPTASRPEPASNAPPSVHATETEKPAPSSLPTGEVGADSPTGEATTPKPIESAPTTSVHSPIAAATAPSMGARWWIVAGVVLAIGALWAVTRDGEDRGRGQPERRALDPSATAVLPKEPIEDLRRAEGSVEPRPSSPLPEPLPEPEPEPGGRAASVQAGPDEDFGPDRPDAVQRAQKPDDPGGAERLRPTPSEGKVSSDTEVPSAAGGDGLARRAVPPGSSPEAARAFERIPVSGDDRPPVGGIGNTGIHIDRISVGSEYTRGDCAGHDTGFSIASRERVNVCFRVVKHRNQAEEITVLWEREGGGAKRRTKMSVPEKDRAFRTRAYLLLRGEYVGNWTVRLLSSDGVELASRSFSVAE